MEVTNHKLAASQTTVSSKQRSSHPPNDVSLDFEQSSGIAKLRKDIRDLSDLVGSAVTSHRNVFNKQQLRP